MGITGDRTVGILKKAMEAASLRHKVMANNVANVNTPGFKAGRVSFEDAMRAAEGMSKNVAIEKTNERHIGIGNDWASVEPEVFRDESVSERLDGNNVDVESEMVGIAANQLLYNTLAQQMSNKISMLRYAIHEGRR